MMPFLSRNALARVVTSLLKSELKAGAAGTGPTRGDLLAAEAWPEDLPMAGDGSLALPGDSLDLLRLAAAVNEMFHLHEAGQERDLLDAGTFADWLDSIEAAWAGGAKRITFMTSGSTGKPKPCTHEFSFLQTEVDYLADLFADRTRIVALVPAHHIYGFLFTAMLPDRLGLSPQAPGEGAMARVPGSFQGGDLVVSFPERWQWMNRTVAHWPEDVAGVVSTAPCPPELKQGLVERGLGSLTEVYGSSETAGLGVRRWPETRYCFMPQWTVHDVSAVDGMVLTHSSGLQVRVKDHIEVHEDGRFTLAGRLDHAVQVGGTNVFPERIAALLRDQPGVNDAIVRLSPLAQGGRLKAFVVPRADVDPEELQWQLEAWVSRGLATAERPKSITFGARLPKDEMGKDSDW